MGKTIKGANKAKAKKAAIAQKIARKCKGGKCAAVALVLLLILGCAQSGPQPSRAIYQRFDVKDCRFTFNAGKTASTNNLAGIEMFTATQANEGSETMSPTSTPTTTVDVPITVKYNDAIAGATTASRSVLGVIGDGLDAVLGLMQSKSSGTVTVKKIDGTPANVKCEDGQCSWCPDCVVSGS